MTGVDAAHAESGGGQVSVREEQWTEPRQGLRYLVRVTDVPYRVHVLFVDLTQPGVKILTTPYPQRWQSVSDYAAKNHLAAAVNGGFWGKMMRAWGMAAGGGYRWPVGEDDADIGFFAVTHEGRAWISPPERVVDQIDESRVSQAVSGMPQLVRSGQVDSESLAAFDHARYRHPRSAVGVAKHGREVILVVVSGRQSHSRGMTLYELAELFVEFGAEAAVNLDGGGSSAMYVRDAGGIVNSPSGGRWIARLGLGAEHKSRKIYRTRLGEEGKEEVFVRGVEREVMNHIGVIAPHKLTDAGVEPGPAASAKPSAAIDEVHVSTPRPPPLSMGRAREILFPLIYVGIALFGVAVCAAIIYFWRRRRKRN